MGTSVNQSSPSTVSWNAVRKAYESEAIPVERVLNLIWRAAEIQRDVEFHEMLTSPILLDCQKAVVSHNSPAEALRDLTRRIAKTKANSIFVELGKRAVPRAFAAEDRADGWRKAFFSELSSYFVSRDAPGFLSKTCRNKTVNDLISFKDSVSKTAQEVVAQIPGKPRTRAEWTAYAKRAVESLKGY